ncbi:hypothetical protein B2J88_45540 [Rhodococcus sp. SRB_17]|uniref:class I SAM-dependent methyltransferase n=1 Tax=Acidovorax sp. SRB_24 TaxID=1962700 RepID=UPI00145C8832|nr:methionine biosynthesis protein MetW [Acidovorax sp. SRB_24]NMM75347.1 hypothetical protein [Acidovorax sp. SRB_24]NMM91487.1 hypothetical protein [Rhodococcus sp. SRB_17]
MHAEDRQASYTSVRADIVELVPHTADHVLDVGCSNGALGNALKDLKPGRTVCGIEFDKDFANDAARYLDAVANEDLNVMDWQVVLPGRSFDCLVFADVLEHLVEPQHCLNASLQRLKPGGTVIVSFPNVRHCSSFFAIFIRGRFPRRDRGIFDATHLRWFTVSDGQALLQGCGLTVTSMSLTLRWGDRGGGLVNKALGRLPKAVQHWGPIREFLGYQICFRAAVH